MKIKIVDHPENKTRVIDYPLTLLQFVKIHFSAFGFYRIEKSSPSAYDIFCKFDGSHVCTVSKAAKNDVVTG